MLPVQDGREPRCAILTAMRIITGSYRSRSIAAPRGSATRPTSDRLRETLFNILAPRVADCRFADLYAGSGAVGIEAISRGAAHVTFVEHASAAVGVIRGNLAALKISSGFAVESGRAGEVLLRLARGGVRSSGMPFDVVFLDPPWEAAEEYELCLALLGGEAGRKLLADGCIVVAEHAARSALCERYGRLQRTRAVRQGDAALAFYEADEASGTD